MIQALRLTSLLLLMCPVAGCKPDDAVRHSSDMDVATARADARMRSASKPLSREEAVTTNDGRPVIVCFGDSLTAGYGTGSGESYPEQLQRLIDADGFRYRVVNLGVSGETTKDGLSRVDRVMALNPAVVVVEFGGNDGLRGVPIESTRANLDSILSKLVHTRSTVALAGITLPPQYGEDYVHQFEETYKTEASKYRLPFLPFIYKGVYGLPGMIQQDGIHATAKGNQQVAKNIYTLLKPILQKQSAATTTD